jgi:RimJ/RimL family protein N-acetyltransferase
MRSQPVLRDATVSLGAFCDGDTAEIVSAARDPETRRWTTLRLDYTTADARQFVAFAAQSWATGAECVWAMRAPGEARWAGSMALRADHRDPQLADVGFLCAPWARGRGLTTAALRLTCAWGFRELGLARIEWRAHVGNLASRWVAERVGFVFEGTQRQRLVQRGIRRDAWVGGLQPGDLRSVDPPTALAPEVRTEGLLLGPWREQDAPQVLEIAEDPDTRAWSGSMRAMRTLDDAREWMRARRADDDRVDWAVRDADTELLVGRVGLGHFDHQARSCEIGYGVHPGHRRRGVALRAVTAATAYGFESLGLARIALFHAIGNPASCAVATATGFEFEGIERSSFDHGDGVLHDVHRHARLASDPPVIR